MLFFPFREVIEVFYEATLALLSLMVVDIAEISARMEIYAIQSGFEGLNDDNIEWLK